MIELKYKSYDEMPIKAYIKLKDIIKSDEDEHDKELDILSVLADMPLDKLLEYNLSDIQGIIYKCSFLSETNINVKENIKKITVNGIKYKVCDDLQKFTVAQYVDFQNYPKDEEHLAENLSTFVIPVGKKYAEGYDIAKTIQDFNEYLDISTAISLQNFLIKKLVISTKDTLRYLISMMKMMMKKNKTKEAKEAVLKIKELEQKYGYLL